MSDNKVGRCVLHRQNLESTDEAAMFVNICYVRQAFDRKWQLFVVFFFTSGMFHYPSFRCDVVVEAKIENVVRKNTH